MNKIKFSIAIPAFKKQFLKEAIDSCISQVYDNFEVIIVNDASPENLDEIINNYDDERIVYYKNDYNCGALNVVDNWNKCLSYCTGDYVICMGDDDRLLPDTLKEYKRLIDKYPGIGLLHAWTEIIDEKSNFKDLTPPRPEFESAYSVLWNRWENRHKQFIGDWCFEIEWLRQNGGFFKLPLAWSSDDISSIIGATKNGVANSQILCFQYRSSEQTITSTGGVEYKMNAIKAAYEWYKNFLMDEPKNELDLKYRNLSRCLLDKVISKKYAALISQDLYNHPIHIVRWFMARKKYHYDLKTLLYSILLLTTRRNS